MRLFKNSKQINFFLQLQKNKGLTVGFVPTMGALHHGHLGLIEECNKSCNITVCSIFVNPTQFNDKADFEKYPVTTEKDISLLIAANCDVLFLPEANEIYSDEEFINKSFALGDLEKVYEGKFRPGHFQGVCKVLNRLFNIIIPDEVFFGQKDYQQCMVVKKLLDLNPAFAKINMHIAPTLREESGLAMSSRNVRLNADEHEKAQAIYETLIYIKNNLKPGNTSPLLLEAEKKMTSSGLKPEYVDVAVADTLRPVSYWDGHTPLVALIAAFMGNVRLIDNMIVH